MDSTLSEKSFWPTWERGRAEITTHFANSIEPKQAAEFVRGCHRIYEMVLSEHPDVLITTERGGIPLGWAISVIEQEKGAKPIKKIVLPLGMHTDTRHQKTKIIHPTEHKIAITRKLLEHEQVSPAGLGKVAIC